MKKYVITVCIIIALILIWMIGYYVYKNINMNDNPETIKEKANEEVKHLSSSIVTMLNNFNHISYTNYQITQKEVPSAGNQSNQSGSGAGSSGEGSQSSEETKGSQSESEESGSQNETMETSTVEPIGILVNNNKKVDWDSLKQETELMYATWPTTLIDLNSLNVDGSKLLQYSSTMDSLVKALEDENKTEAMKNLSSLHSLLNQYIEQYSNDNNLITSMQTRSYILNAYALAEEDKWDEMKQNITNAKNKYTSLINHLQNANQISNINRGYIVLNEIEKNVNEQNKEVFYINYKNMMQELESLI